MHHCRLLVGYLHARLCRLVVAISLLSACGLAAAQPLPVGASQGSPAGYGDVPETHWAYLAVQRMTDLGLLTGYPEGRFRGEKAASRYELAIIGARLVDYVDSLLALLSDDPELGASLREAAADLREVRDMPARVERLEAALANAASVEYVRSLEARVVALEAQLNAVLGEEVFPAAMTGEDAPLAATDTEGMARQQEAPAELEPADTDGEGLSAAHPLYIGISPGVVSASGQVYLGVQAGRDRLIGPAGLALRLVFNGGSRELRLTTDVTTRFEVLEDRLELYGGIGVGGSFAPEGSTFLLEAPLGMEAFVTPRVGVFLQLVPSYAFAPANRVDAGLTGGLNLRF